MKRLVLDAGPLIALFSAKDDYHEQCKAGFGKLPNLFNEVLTPLPILFEVYKFVCREQSSKVAQTALAGIYEETLVIPMEMKTFRKIYNLVLQMPDWKGSLEDASVVITAQRFEASVWTLDYRDLSWFKNLDLWMP
jgi:predicted nucleic acid-binding protein